ncbi:MAG: isocitrate dehydrogenase (NADP(+)) [Acidobacteria bacterium]|nr:isocitrate dehydrogenase (NADP(+)) [Acidobacteriota bacterium]MBI3658340.1 isocitrate dehydrogenase (NADP(+)) [Acidobacteriota bacterium]
MVTFEKIAGPKEGQPIQFVNGKFQIPDNPIIPFIEGDGTGRDIWRASQRVFDAAVHKVWGSKKKVCWFEVYAGEKAFNMFGEWLPADTTKAIDHFSVAIKGPLTTPVGGGIRSLNVTLRQVLDLYACVRPVRYFRGVPSPVKCPEKLNVVIYRENTEDVYAGIEFQEGTSDAKRLIEFIGKELGKTIRPDSGIGIKPISETGSKRIVRKALQYALDSGRKTVTMVHKGNIMKYTEGAFREWGYELAKQEFADSVITEDDLYSNYKGKLPDGKVVIRDRIADSMFQQVLLRPDEYDVLATPNLNGDYLSDACAAQVGGLGIAPGANISDRVGLFEATHGTAPKYADQDVINPGSVILSGVMMFDYIGWKDVGQAIIQGLERTIAQKRVTYDFHRLMEGATKLKTSEFAGAIIENM